MTTGLILIDIQNDYFAKGKMELVGINTASANMSALLALFRKNQWPTFHIQHISEHEGATFFLPDTKGVELHESISPLAGETIIQKNFPNSFRDTALQTALKQSQVEKLVICGAMSHMCVDATTRAAADLGYPCVVVHDACATKELEFEGDQVSAKKVHSSFMAALEAAYADVMSLSRFQASGV